MSFWGKKKITVVTAQTQPKRQPQMRGKSTFKGSLENGITNVRFSFNGVLNKVISLVETQSQKQYPTNYILGKSLANKKQAERQISKIIWFSYRKIPWMQSIQHDTGWGCLIRVGQMSLAAAIKRYLQNMNPKLTDDECFYYITTAFLDQRNSLDVNKYSLQKVVQMANKMYGLQYGMWFNPSQICSTLEMLHQKSPMSGTQNLCVVHFANIIYIDKIFQIWNLNLCKCIKRQVGCRRCNYIRQKQASNQYINTFLHSERPVKQLGPSQNEFYRNNSGVNRKQSINISPQKHILMYITVRLGEKKVQKRQYQQLLSLLKRKQSNGIVGGQPRRGLYIVGNNQEKLYYLDPHKNQDYIDLKQLKNRLDEFKIEYTLTMNRTDVDPSMSFAFYFKNVTQFSSFIEYIDKMQSEYENSILYYQWQNKYRKYEQQYFHQRCDDEESVYDDLSASRISYGQRQF